jgi:hypothetical protein
LTTISPKCYNLHRGKRLKVPPQASGWPVAGFLCASSIDRPPRICLNAGVDTSMPPGRMLMPWHECRGHHPPQSQTSAVSFGRRLKAFQTQPVNARKEPSSTPAPESARPWHKSRLFIRTLFLMFGRERHIRRETCISVSPLFALRCHTNAASWQQSA